MSNMSRLYFDIRSRRSSSFFSDSDERSTRWGQRSVDGNTYVHFSTRMRSASFTVEASAASNTRLFSVNTSPVVLMSLMVLNTLSARSVWPLFEYTSRMYRKSLDRKSTTTSDTASSAIPHSLTGVFLARLL